MTIDFFFFCIVAVISAVMNVCLCSLSHVVLLTAMPGVLDGLFIVWHRPEVSWPVVSSCETVVVEGREV